MFALLGVVVLVVFILALFIGRSQEKLWVRWGLLVALGLGILIYVLYTMRTIH